MRRSSAGSPGYQVPATEGPPFELTVFAFGKEAGSVLDNVNRWRKLDVGLPPVEAADLDKLTRETSVNGVKVTRVDMAGPGVKKRGGMGR